MARNRQRNIYGEFGKEHGREREECTSVRLHRAAGIQTFHPNRFIIVEERLSDSKFARRNSRQQKLVLWLILSNNERAKVAAKSVGEIEAK